MKILLTIAAALLLAVPVSAQIHGVVSVDDDPVLGNPDAKVTMIEFGDYQCPSCRAFWREIEPRIKKEYIDKGTVKLVFRDFPLTQIHPDAFLAAQAVNCAIDQNKYWQYHDKVFLEQDKQSEENIVRVSANDLKKWAKDVKMDPVAFGACLDSGKYKEEVSKDMADGNALGVPGTPMFFINGNVIGGAQQYPAYKKLIDSLLAK
jgi:protein-disulfide isomerase